MSLPREGYSGAPPVFPLMPRRVLMWEFGEKGARWQVLDAEATEIVQDREARLWEWAWSTPQASVWAGEPWRWQAVAQWVRTSVICETDAATAADRGSLHRFADQIGLTPAGLRENGWQVAPDEVAAARESRAAVKQEPAPRQRRLRAAGD